MSFMRGKLSTGDGSKAVDIGDNRASSLMEAIGSMGVGDCRLFMTRLMFDMGVPLATVAKVFRAKVSDFGPDGSLPDRPERRTSKPRNAPVEA